jgi:WD40 repeat protein
MRAAILALVWTPNGKTIVTSSSDGSIRFRDAATLDPLRVIDHQPDWVQALSISPDGTRLAAGRYNGSLTLYDAKAQSAPQTELRADGSAGLLGIRGIR